MLHLRETFFLMLLPACYIRSTITKTQQKYLGYTFLQANIDQWPRMLTNNEQGALTTLPVVWTKASKPFIHRPWRRILNKTLKSSYIVLK